MKTWLSAEAFNQKAKTKLSIFYPLSRLLHTYKPLLQ